MPGFLGSFAIAVPVIGRYKCSIPCTSSTVGFPVKNGSTSTGGCDSAPDALSSALCGVLVLVATISVAALLAANVEHRAEVVSKVMSSRTPSAWDSISAKAS